MRNLAYLALAGLLFSGSVMAQTLPKKFDLPSRFENYRERVDFSIRNLFLKSGVRLHEHRFNLYGDDKPEVVELFLYLGYDSKNRLLHPEHPIAYWFDINGNNEFETGEVYWDGEMDTFDGNEEVMEIKNGDNFLRI